MNGNKRQMLILEITVVACMLIVTCAMVASVVYTSHSLNDRRIEQVAGCVRANQQRAYINTILFHHPEIKFPPIIIPDCEEIVR
jgi:hypothetical protein